ncbi:MAG TPA: hypothetical protein VGC07_00810 [Granulicella sp.]
MILSKLFGKKPQPQAEPHLPEAQAGEVKPPWAEYPGIPPWEFFWREAGEPWLKDVWEPYYQRLTPEQQEAYRKRWNVPKDWQESYFDKAWQEFWDHVDDEEP